jgi:GTPase SAR1 family protein
MQGAHINVVLVGDSSVGKSYLCRKLISYIPNKENYPEWMMNLDEEETTTYYDKTYYESPSKRVTLIDTPGNPYR